MIKNEYTDRIDKIVKNYLKVIDDWMLNCLKDYKITKEDFREGSKHYGEIFDKNNLKFVKVNSFKYEFYKDDKLISTFKTSCGQTEFYIEDKEEQNEN